MIPVALVLQRDDAAGRFRRHCGLVIRLDQNQSRPQLRSYPAPGWPGLAAGLSGGQISL